MVLTFCVFRLQSPDSEIFCGRSRTLPPPAGLSRPRVGGPVSFFEGPPNGLGFFPFRRISARGLVPPLLLEGVVLNIGVSSFILVKVLPFLFFLLFFYVRTPVPFSSPSRSFPSVWDFK